MSKEIVMSGWVSAIPTDMFNGWVKKRWIEKKAFFITSTKEKKPYSMQILEKGENIQYPEQPGKFWVQPIRKEAKSLSEIRRLETQGFKKTRKQFYVPEKSYNLMRNQIAKWYDKVFDYVTKWLTKNGYIKLKKGSFDGGFCAVTTEDQTTSGWGAPLAEEENKVVQIKEKFGDIRVYFTSLTKEERKQIEQFEKDVEKKFDCRTCFC